MSFVLRSGLQYTSAILQTRHFKILWLVSTPWEGYMSLLMYSSPFLSTAEKSSWKLSAYEQSISANFLMKTISIDRRFCFQSFTKCMFRIRTTRYGLSQLERGECILNTILMGKITQSFWLPRVWFDSELHAANILWLGFSAMKA